MLDSRGIRRVLGYVNRRDTLAIRGVGARIVGVRGAWHTRDVYVVHLYAALPVDRQRVPQHSAVHVLDIGLARANGHTIHMDGARAT